MTKSYFKKTNSTISSTFNSLPKERSTSLKIKALKPLSFLIWHHFLIVRSPLKMLLLGGWSQVHWTGIHTSLFIVYNFSNNREVLMWSCQNTLLSFSVFSTTVLSVKINGINFTFLEWYIVSRIALEVSLPLNIKDDLEVIGGNLTNLKYYYTQGKKKPNLENISHLNSTNLSTMRIE